MNYFIAHVNFKTVSFVLYFMMETVCTFFGYRNDVGRSLMIVMIVRGVITVHGKF